MLVHPEPGGGVFPDDRLELVQQACAIPGAKRPRKIQSGDEKPRGNARRAAARNGR